MKLIAERKSFPTRPQNSQENTENKEGNRKPTSCPDRRVRPMPALTWQMPHGVDMGRPHIVDQPPKEEGGFERKTTAASEVAAKVTPLL